jgi:hypothetical protein
MHMGIKWPSKWKCLPEEHGLTEWAISITSRHHHTHNNPYGAGVHSGTWAKPNALSHPPLQSCPLRAYFCDLVKNMWALEATTFHNHFHIYIIIYCVAKQINDLSKFKNRGVY